VGGRQLFMEFEYMSDPYDMVDKIRDEEQERHRSLTSDKKTEFRYASARPQPLSRPIGYGESSHAEMQQQKEVGAL
jgi:hypothetical protein